MASFFDRIKTGLAKTAQQIRERLSEFMADHERHVRDLRAAVRSS